MTAYLQIAPGHRITTEAYAALRGAKTRQAQPWAKPDAHLDLRYWQVRALVDDVFPAVSVLALDWSRSRAWVHERVRDVDAWTDPARRARWLDWYTLHRAQRTQPRARTPDGQTMPHDLAALVDTAARAKLAELPRQAGALVRLGHTRDELHAAVVSACVRKWQFPGSRWDPSRGDLGTWVYQVVRGELGNMLAARELTVVGGDEDVAVTAGEEQAAAWDSYRATRRGRRG